MIKVLFLRTIRGLDAPSGAEIYLSYLARYLKKHEVSPFFLFSIDPNRDCSRCLSEFEKVGAEFEVVHVPGKFSVKDMNYAWETADRVNADIIHTMDHRADCIGAILHHLGTRPVVASFQGWTGFAENSWRLHLYGRIDSLALRTMNTVFIDSRRMAENLGRFAASKKIHFIPNGIDVERFHPGRLSVDRTGSLTFLQIARFHPNKGQLDFVQAAARVVEKYPNARFILIGDCNKGSEHYAENVRAYVRNHALRQVVFHASVGHEQLPQMIANADVLVAPSHYEGLSLAVLEAMSMEKLVISYDSGGIGEALTHEKTALLSQVGDIEAFAKEMIKVFESKEKVKRIAENGRRLVIQRYNVEVMVAKVARQYHSVLAAL